MKQLFLTLCACLCATLMSAKDVYLFSYFRGEKDGLHLAYSYDGLTWTALNNNRSLLRPTVGDDKLMRDPSIIQGGDGTFHMVWTSSWHDHIIGYASSKDLVHWSEQCAIPVMADEPEAQNCWAPELFFDEPTNTYYIIWATTIPGRHGKVASIENEKQWNHRIYYTTTKDFQTFTKTQMFFNPDFNVIDAAIVRDAKTGNNLMVVKNENSLPAEKNLRITQTKSLRSGFPTKVSAPITKVTISDKAKGNDRRNWVEGPAPLFVGDTLYIYFDRYIAGGFGAVRSVDHGKTWSDVSDLVSFPQGIRHGTAFKVSDEEFQNLRLALGDMPQVTWDEHSLMFDGKRIVPAMGEVHYSRIPAEEWQREVQQMKAGGINMLACYVFWNHIEEIEGQYDWSGQRNLRAFLEVCKEQNMPVVLRVGPFCHGEVRCGGIPDWVIATGCKTRSQDPRFLKYVERLYRQIFTQVQGLQWKDGGPVIAAQFDNEYRGSGDYLLALKRIATNVGFDLPFYTRTGWPELSKPVPFGELIPLYGDYADGFWDRSIKPCVGEYYKAFNFRSKRTSDAIASEQLDYSNTDKSNVGVQQYPYFTCELGGGMMTSYHRRVYMYPEDAYAMAVVKLGSGSNLLGYYMYHGGTNPEGKLTYLNEKQQTPATNWNDLPVMTYDFQAPLNEFGQRNPHFYLLRKLHLFMKDYGEVLAPMTTTYPCEQDIPQGDDSHLRWSYRSKGNSGFVFINNYERLQNLTEKKNVQIETCGVNMPKISVPAGVSCIFPINIDGIKYATAQIVAKRHGHIYLEQIKGIPTEIAIDGKVLRNVKPGGISKPIYKNIYLLNSDDAGRLFLNEPVHETTTTNVQWKKQKEASELRAITIGVAKVAEEPVDADFENAAVYTIGIPADREGILNINYRGDVARLYADGKLIDDNFYNGRPFQYALWRLNADCKQLELRILPLQKDMPVYFPKEADIKALGEEVLGITIEK